MLLGRRGILDLSEVKNFSVEEQTGEFAQRMSELNRRMLKLPMTARRDNWGYYYRRVCELNGPHTVNDQRRLPTQLEQNPGKSITRRSSKP